MKAKYEPNLASGSTYSAQIEVQGAKLIITQDNEQQVVLHLDDLQDLNELVKKLVK